jgi:hypothetical protein
VIGSDREGCILNRDAALDLALSDVAEAGEQVFSVHASRAAELEAHAARNAWLRLTVRVTTRWGEALHGLPGGGPRHRCETHRIDRKTDHHVDYEGVDRCLDHGTHGASRGARNFT